MKTKFSHYRKSALCCVVIVVFLFNFLSPNHTSSHDALIKLNIGFYHPKRMSNRPRILSFASIRLNDLSDDYGFGDDLDLTIVGDDAVEEAVEASKMQMADDNVTSISVGADHEGSDTDSQQAERISIGSNESKDTQTTKLGAFIEKAKSKGRQLVSSKKDAKTPVMSETASQCRIVGASSVEHEKDEKTQVDIMQKKKDGPLMVYSLARRCRTMPFFKYRIMMLGILIAITFVSPSFFTGLFWGLYLSFTGFLYLFVSEPRQKIDRHPSFASLDDANLYRGALDQAREANDDDGNAMGLGDGVVYRGWMNELKSKYSPATYHVNNAQSVLVRLEGSTLRISRPAKAALKHAFHEDPTLTQPQPTMVSQTIYNLEGAQVSLRPKRLAPRRWWSRKYPIHIRFPHRTAALDLSKPLSRSVSMHPVESAPDALPFLSAEDAPVDEGYNAETESSDESEPEPQRINRTNSFCDMPNYVSVFEGSQRLRKGRSINLFVRAAREKERWFHLLREACALSQSSRSKPLGTRRVSELSYSIDDNLPTPPRSPSNPFFEDILYSRSHKQFAEQISLMLGCGVPAPERGSTVSMDLGTMKWRPGIPEENSDLVESVNALATRIFFDFCRDEFWKEQVKFKIQSKLATVHLPYFIETLELSSLSLGKTAPKIVGVYAPKLNEWGIWVDLEMKYGGGTRLVIQTSVNLMKLQSGSTKVEADRKLSRFTSIMARNVSHYSDQDLPESPESSPDEDFGAKNNLDGVTTKERTGKKIISMMERAAQSSLFQKAAKISKVAKLIEDVSSTPLILNVEVEMLEGALTVNIPPPPSDRLWYAFRRPPLTSIKAVPQVGDRSVDLTTVSDWIESKLRLLIEKNLVCPNMDDIILPVMSGNELLRKGAYNQ